MQRVKSKPCRAVFDMLKNRQALLSPNNDPRIQRGGARFDLGKSRAVVSIPLSTVSTKDLMGGRCLSLPANDAAILQRPAAISNASQQYFYFTSAATLTL